MKNTATKGHELEQTNKKQTDKFCQLHLASLIRSLWLPGQEEIHWRENLPPVNTQRFRS